MVRNVDKAPYHHGNLAVALVDAGFELAGEGGGHAVTVREAARRVGVSAPAAYRHFADRERFVAAVARRCRQQLATEMAVARDRHRLPLKRFHAVGRAYIDFALAHPGLIEVAFAADPDDVPDDPDAFVVLVDALEALSAAGLLPAKHRDGAEIVAWASVHGIAVLLARSPELSGQAETMAERVLTGIEVALGLQR